MFCFKSRLKELRKQNNLTQSYMANLLNIIPTAYQKYEYGMREPKLNVLYHIADYFCISSDWLLGLSDNMHRDYYLAVAERKFFNDPNTKPELILRYQKDKADNPIAAPTFLHTYESIRDNKNDIK